MARNVRHNKAWVITWICSSPSRSTLPADTMGQPLVVLPGRSSERAIEGAMCALLQIINGDAEFSAGQLRRTADTVEWDYAHRNAKVGVGLEVWATHADVTYDGRVAARNATAGAGVITYEPTARWQTRAEYRAELLDEMRLNGELPPATGDDR